VKCPKCGGAGRWGQAGFIYLCENCNGTGLVKHEKFWTPAERAGLKAMGAVYKSVKKSKAYSYGLKCPDGTITFKIWARRRKQRGELWVIHGAIRAYVKAARSVKG